MLQRLNWTQPSLQISRFPSILFERPTMIFTAVAFSDHILRNHFSWLQLKNYLWDIPWNLVSSSPLPQSSFFSLANSILRRVRKHVSSHKHWQTLVWTRKTNLQNEERNVRNDVRPWQVLNRDEKWLGTFFPEREPMYPENLNRYHNVEISIRQVLFLSIGRKLIPGRCLA